MITTNLIGARVQKGNSTSWRSVGAEHCDLPQLLPLVVWDAERDGG